MTIRVNNFKKMVEGKRVSLLGKVRTRLSAVRASMFVTRSRENSRKKLESKMKEILEEISGYETNIEHAQKQYFQVSSEGTVDDTLTTHYQGIINDNQDKLYRAQAKLAKLQKNVDRLDDKDADYYEFVVSDRIRKHYRSFGDPIHNEMQKKRRLASYFVNGAFEFGDKRIDVRRKADQKTYVQIMREFEKTEDSYGMNYARSLESIGIATVGSDFIRKYVSLNNENRDIINEELSNIFTENVYPSFVSAAAFETYQNSSLEDQVRALRKISLPSLRLEMEDMLEQQKLNPVKEEQKGLPGKVEVNESEINKAYTDEQKAWGASVDDPVVSNEKNDTKESEQPTTPIVTIEKIDENEKVETKTDTEQTLAPSDIETSKSEEKENIQSNEPIEVDEPAVESEIKEVPVEEKDEYTVAMEVAQTKQDEIKQKMSDVRNKFERKVQDAAVFYQNDPDAIYSIREANAAELNEELNNLEEQLAAARQEEHDAFMARRQEKIEADKKAREERINELNKKAKEKWEEQQHTKEVDEAKAVLSHLETSTGTYDISGLTDEEILETYNSIKSSPGMVERLESARVAAENDKVAEEKRTSELQEESTIETSEVVNDDFTNIPEDENTVSEPVQETSEEPELKGLDEEDLDKLADKANEQTNEQAIQAQEIMDKFGVSEEQAKSALQDPVIMQVIEQTYGNPSAEKTESKTR